MNRVSELGHIFRCGNIRITTEPSDTLTKPVNTLLLLFLFITMVDA